MKEEHHAHRPATKQKAGFQFRNRTIIALVLFSVTSTLMTVSRPTIPHVLPLPRYEQSYSAKLDQQELARALQVRDGSLKNAVRAVGELLRRAGRQLALQGRVSTELLEDLRTSAHTLISEGRGEELRALRALQSELFVQALYADKDHDVPSSDVIELGGDFRRLAELAWMDEAGNYLLSRSELKLMFRAHFNRLTGLQDDPMLGLSLEEQRHYYALLIEFPPAPTESPAAIASARLQFARALSKVDPGYDDSLLAGILELQIGRAGHAEAHLHKYRLSGARDYAHLARGHYLYALRLADLRLTQYAP